MKKIRAAKIFAGFLAASMVLNAVPPNGLSGLVSATAETDAAVASVTVNGTTTNYADFIEAWNAAKEAKTATVELKANVTFDPMYISDNPFTVEQGEDITFDGGDFSISYTNDSPYFDGGPSVFAIVGGKLTVNGGTINTASGENTAHSCIKVGETAEDRNGTLVINDGNFISSNAAIDVNGGNVQLMGGTYTSGNRSLGAIFCEVFSGLKISDLLCNYGDYTADKHYAFKSETSGLYDRDKLNATETVAKDVITVVECDHNGVQLGHGEMCEYCGGMTDPHELDENGECTRTDCTFNAVAFVTANDKTLGYATFEEAWDAAARSGKAVIDVLADITCEKQLVLNGADITLSSSNNSTVNYASGGSFIYAESGKLTINSGKYTNTGEYASGGSLTHAESGKLMINSDEYISSGEVIVVGEAEVIINGGEFSGKIGLYVLGKGQGEKPDFVESYGLAEPFDYNRIKLCGGTFTGTEYAINAGELCLEELLWENGYAYYDKDGKVIAGILNDKSVKQTVTVKECDHSAQGYIVSDMEHIKGCLGCGIAEGEPEPHSWENDVCSVCKAAAVAEVGNEKYSTLRRALYEALDTGSELTLLNDAVVDDCLNIFGNITINGGGHTITFECDVDGYDENPAGTITVRENSSLTLNNVSVKAAEGYDVYSVICNSGDLNITGCTVTGNTTSDHVTPSRTTYGIYNYNNGNLIAANCTISGGNAGICANGGVVEVTGGAVSGVYNGVELKNCTAKITDCNISSGLNYKCGLNFKGNVNAEIKNCNISADYGINGNNYYGDNKFVIDGGTITAAFRGISIMKNAEAVITGGCKIQRDTSVSLSNTTTGIIEADNAKSISLEDCKITGFDNAISTNNSSNPVSGYLADNCYCWDSESNIITATDVQTISVDVDIHPCTHGDTTFTDNGDGTHSGSCTICNKKVTNELHTYNSKGVCTVCGSQAAIKVDNSSTIYFTNSIYDAVSNIEGANNTITLLDNISLTEDLVLSVNNYVLDLNGHTISGGSFKNTDDTSILDVRSSNGGSIECDIESSVFYADGNPTLGNVTADNVIISGKDVQIEALTVSQSGMLRGGSYGYISLGAEVTFADLLNSLSGNEGYYAYYKGGKPVELATLTDMKGISNVAVKHCNHEEYEYSLEKNEEKTMHNGICKHCRFAMYHIGHKFKETGTSVNDEKRTVTATCVCGAVLTFTLGDRECVYNGEVQKPTVTGKFTFGDTTILNLAEDNDYYIRYSDENYKNAGLHRIGVNCFLGFNNNYELFFNIEKAKPFVSWADTTVTYTGEQANITLPVKNSLYSGEIAYSYALKGTNTFTDGVPVDAGVYTLKASVEETENFKAGEITSTLTITQANGSFNITENEITKTYGDEEFTITPANKVGDGEFSFTSSDTDVATVDENGNVTIKGAGECTITVTLADGTNYTGADSKTINVTVDKAENPPTMPSKTMNAAYSCDKVGSAELPEGWKWSAADKDKEIAGGGTVTATACYTKSDKGNYENIEVTIKITRSNCEHNYTSEVTTAATCTESGVKTYTCDCGDSYTETIPATGHSYRSEITTEPTVESEGVRTYTCDNCGDSYTESIEKLPKPDHKHNYTSEVTTAATCTESGVKTYTCDCGDSYTETIPATEHNYRSEITTEPTVDSEGVRTYTCGNCGDSYTESIEKLPKPDHKHNYTSEVTTAATCTESGVKTYTCDCGDSYTETIPATGHSYRSEITTEPTVDSEGVRTYTCDNCGDSYTESIEKLPKPDHKHNYTSEVTTAATCTESGVKTYTCDCGDSYTETIPATGHNYRSEITTEPTVDSEGVRTYTCGNCGDSYTESIEKLPKPDHKHNYTSEVTTAATCTESGVKTYTCDCGDSYTETIAALGHDYHSEVTKKPTTSEEGVRTYTCSRCGDSYTENIPKLDDTPDAPKPDDTDKPFINGEDGKEGWDVIRAEVDITKDGDEITVEMNGTTEVPGDILNSIKGEDITITFDMGNGVLWSVNGKDVTEATGSIDFGVKVGSGDIPVDVINNVTGENYSMQLSLNHDGEFGFKATLSVELGAESAGSYASLYYYNEQSGEPEFISESKITENGIANLEFTHASDYVIVVNAKSRFDEDEPDASSDTPASSTDSGDGFSTSGDSKPNKNPNTGTNISYIAALISATGVVGLFVTMRRKKNRQR